MIKAGRSKILGNRMYTNYSGVLTRKVCSACDLRPLPGKIPSRNRREIVWGVLFVESFVDPKYEYFEI